MGHKLNMRIIAHGRKLQKIFPAVASMDPIALCKKLRRLESMASRSATNLCNVTDYQESHDLNMFVIEEKLDALLQYRAAGVPVETNGDPRGYALKIDDAYVRANRLDIHTDFGGYGILAPDLTEED